MTEQVRSYAAATGFRSTYLVTAAVGGVVAWLAFDNGGYSLTTWTGAAVAVWWGLALAVGVRPFPFAHLRWPARLAAAGLGLMSLFSLLSTAWAADAERAYLEAAQIAFYLGVFLVVVLCAGRNSAGAWLDGLELGVVAIALLALASRLFPSLGLGRTGASVLPAVVTRLSYPIGYWNGLAIFVALAVPLLLRTALNGRTEVVRAGAVALVPFLAADVYLASSRGGALVAAVGVVAFLATAGRPWATGAAVLSALAGSAIAVVSLHSRSALLDGPVTSRAAATEGRSALALLVVASLVSALLSLALRRVGTRAKPSRLIALGAAGVVGVVLVAAIVASHPVARFHAFERPPPTAPGSTSSHFLNANGSGRWQFWSAALDEWRTAKLGGRGAGSFPAWWHQHGSLAMPTQDAHSVFLQTLAESGAIGFACVALVWIFGPAAGLILARREEESERIEAAAAASVAAAFAVGAAIDWVWHLPAVTLVGVAALALALGRGSPERRLRLHGRRLLLLVPLPLLVVAFELVPLTGGIALEQSRRAAGRGDPQAATTAALRARALEPWAVSPLEQLALVDESRNRLAAAQTWIDRARRTDGDNWQVRLIAARIETKRGDVAAARRDLAAVRLLYPRLPLFAAG